jgi:uncharacterized protein (TIGR02611 family)
MTRRNGQNPVSGISYRAARRVVVTVAGGTMLLVGVAMIVLPGPALVVIPAGLAIMALEFAWARRWLRKLKKEILPRLQPDDEQQEAASNEPNQEQYRR